MWLMFYFIWNIKQVNNSNDNNIWVWGDRFANVLDFRL